MITSVLGRRAPRCALRVSHVSLVLFVLLISLSRGMAHVPGLEADIHERVSLERERQSTAAPPRRLLQTSTASQWSICFDGEVDAMRVDNSPNSPTEVVGISLWVKIGHPSQQPHDGNLYLLEVADTAGTAITTQ